MSVTRDLVETIRKLSALEARTGDVLGAVRRLEDKLDTLMERVVSLEANQRHLKDTVKNEIYADVIKTLVQQASKTSAAKDPPVLKVNPATKATK